MNQDFQLKLQAHLDGELSERESREVATVLAGDAEARALQAELRNTARALDGFETGIKLPESPEFYWSKIQREIQRVTQAEPPQATRLPLWRRFLMPAGALAAFVIVAAVTFKQIYPLHAGDAVAVETVLRDSGAMTYRDQAEGMTVVWLSYPPENEFADPDWDDTLP